MRQITVPDGFGGRYRQSAAAVPLIGFQTRTLDSLREPPDDGDARSADPALLLIACRAFRRSQPGRPGCTLGLLGIGVGAALVAETGVVCGLTDEGGVHFGCGVFDLLWLVHLLRPFRWRRLAARLGLAGGSPAALSRDQPR
jgi:hypothetical protein